MGIRVTCPNGHSLNVKEHLAGRVGRCPKCGSRVNIPAIGASGEADAPAPPGEQPGPAQIAPALPQPAQPTRQPSVADPVARPVVVVAEEPLVARSGVMRDPRALAKRRDRQRRMALVVLTLLSVALAVVLVWVLRRQ